MAIPSRCKLCVSELSSRMAFVTVAVIMFHAVPFVCIQFHKQNTEKSSSLYQVQEFKPNASTGLRHLAVNPENEDVFVGAVNYIYNLDKNLKLKTSAQTGPMDDSGRCYPPIPDSIPCKYPKKPMDNFNKVLLVENRYHRLIVCGTLYHGYCERRDLSNIKIRDTPDYSHSVVSNNASASTVAFIAPGPKNTTSLYVSVSYSDDPQVVVDDIPAFASRNLINFSLTRKDTFHETAFKIDTQTKQQFPIYYIYGFGSELFSYTMAVQKKDERDFHSVIFRVCQNDSRFYSHVEVPLSCTFGNTTYNILQAAAVGKASVPLANQLVIDSSRDVLYGVFAESERFSVKPTTKSAMCIFPMNYVRKVFTENIQRCFNGTGSSGGGHLGTPIDCSVNTEFKIDDNYCGFSDSNQPLGGTIPIEGKVVIEFPTSMGAITSLLMTVVNNYTVAFAGTEDGNIVKVSLQSLTAASVYETVPVAPGTQIHPDLKFDNLRTNLFVLTSSKVVKIKVKDCDQYLTCESCLAAKDPYCGWCVLQSKCSGPETCDESDLDKRWLPHNEQECPEIKSVKPMPISTDSESLLTLDIQNLPEFKDRKIYKCQFSSIGKDKFQPLTSEADRNNNKFQCYTPKTSSLPKFKNGKDSIDMKLSVLMSNQELVYKTVSFFNCNTHSNCTACMLSQFPCFWCIKNHRCTDSPENYCQNDELVASKPDPTNSNASPGPEFCPRFRDVRNKTEILVPAGSFYNVKVIGISLYDFQLDNLKCQFHIDKIETVVAVANFQQGRTFEIVCSPVQFNYVMGRHESQDVSVVVSWGQDYPLDNPSSVLVVMYKCSVMAKTCGECLIAHAKYKCGWCETSSSRCTTEDFCPTPTKFRKRGKVCQNAVITEFSPHSGPKEGGTLITISGENLGANSTDIQVTIDLVTCELVSFEAPKRIICKTNKANFKQLEGKIDVIVGNQERTQSTERFSFVEPKVVDIFPSIGPQAGGTTITLLGDHLDAGSNVTVVIGQDRPCTQPQSLNSSALICKTSPHDSISTQPMNIYVKIDNTDLTPTGAFFSYVQNPNVTWTSRKSVIRSGGLKVNVSGEYLDHVQFPLMLIWLDNQAYSGPCNFTSKPSTNITCISPPILGLPKDLKPAQKLDFGFRMDHVTYLEKLSNLGKMAVYADPHLEPFEKKGKVQPQNQDILFIKGTNLDQVKDIDVKVSIGKGDCAVASVISTVITCKTPPEQPAALSGSGPPQVVVRIGEKLSYELGVLRYEEQEGLSMTVIIIIAVVVPLVLIALIAFFVICAIRSLRNDDLMKKMKKEMDQLESRVANECKEAFAELQTNMSELTNDMAGGLSIPFWDYRTYCMRVLFPGCNNHPVISELELDYHHREDIQHGLKLFFSLIKNKTFLLTFIRTLESRKEFTMKERVKVASLISVALQTQMEYATEILKVLLAELIEKNSSKSHPQLLLRRNESVAEKMLTNWFTFLLYKFLKECAGEPLFMLYGAIKQQVSNGPVDAVTGEARYSLSEDKLIRQQINFKPMVIHVMDIDADWGQPAHTVKVLDCDTISQVKEKILDAIFKSASFSSRPIKEKLDLVSFDHPPEWSIGDKSQISLKMFPSKDTKRLLLYDEDNTSKMEGNYKRLNTLSHYKVPDGAYVALQSKQTYYNLSMNPDKSFKYNDNSYYNRSPSLNRSVNHQKNINNDPEGSKVYHLVRHHDAELPNREGERGSKMMSEIYLPRLLVTKGTLQTFVDDLFERIFSTASGGHVLPLAIKYMFDFLDDQAMLHNVSDEVVRNWKSNSLPLRFWVNVIKNPDFAFDIYKSNIVDACLTVIGQTFMDCCSNQEHKLTKDSPSNKLLYAKDIPKYKQWVARYYEDIKIMPAISDQDMTAMLAEESRSHQNEFNTNAALLELYTYVKTYYDDIANALDEDEFAKKSKLSNKLEQVCSTLDGNLIC